MNPRYEIQKHIHNELWCYINGFSIDSPEHKQRQKEQAIAYLQRVRNSNPHGQFRLALIKGIVLDV